MINITVKVYKFNQMNKSTLLKSPLPTSINYVTINYDKLKTEYADFTVDEVADAITASNNFYVLIYLNSLADADKPKIINCLLKRGWKYLGSYSPNRYRISDEKWVELEFTRKGVNTSKTDELLNL